MGRFSEIPAGGYSASTDKILSDQALSLAECEGGYAFSVFSSGAGIIVLLPMIIYRFRHALSYALLLAYLAFTIWNSSHRFTLLRCFGQLGAVVLISASLLFIWNNCVIQPDQEDQ